MKLAGIFSGMGSQWPSMAQTLLPHWPVFGQELAKLDLQIQQQFGWSVSQLLENADAAKLAKPDIANPCIFAVQLALFRQLQALGLHFDMVLGHSTGEFAAACAAGVLKEVDALQLMHSHNQLIELASQQTGYAMAQLTLTDDELAQAQQQQPDVWQGVVVAAQNSPQTQIVSGPELQLQSLVQAQQTQQRFARLLSGAVPFHSPYLPEFTTEVPQIEPQQAAMALYSSLRGRQLAAAEMDTDYWQQHIRQPVRFYSAVQQMLQDGADCLLEIAPHHILLFSLHDIVKACGAQTRVIPTLKRDADCHQQLQAALAAIAAEPEMTMAVHSDNSSSDVSMSASRDEVLQVICRQLQLLLPDTSQGLDPARGFFQLGLTSVQVLTFCQRLAAELKCAPDFSWCFDYPTPLQLAAVLSGAAQLSVPTSATAAACTEIAIVGMGCRFPGGANNPDLFWQHLVEGKSAICEVPAERWQADAYYAEDDTPGKSRSKWAGFLKDWDVRQFDAALFDISPAEARALDPQQRLLLEVTYEALQHAGLVSGQNLPQDTGVFVGISTDDYKASQLYSGDLTKINTYTGAGCMYSAAAGRLSYWLGLQGPNKAVDTACSSSLVALHDACQAIRQGECSTALVAGVNLMLTPHLFVCFSALGALSTDGKCRAFAEGANGYVRGEGCGVLVLKSRAQAEADGDQILALIAGTAVNQDGISSSLTAPNGAAQQLVIRSALARAGVSASQISYVETHGTGTPLGDPIEAKALGTVYGQAVDRSTPLQIGSGKTVFGHLEAAAGILSVIKTTLCLQHQQLVPSRNFDTPSPLIDFAGLKLQVVTELQSTALQYAAVSSFGFSGTNAHIILSAPPAITSSTKASAPEVTGSQLLTLSARNAAALAALGRDWLQILSQQVLSQQAVSQQIVLQKIVPQSTTTFADLCRASYLQRPHLRYRLAVTGTDAATMAARLDEALADGAAPAPVTELALPVLLSAQMLINARQHLLQFCEQPQTQAQTQTQTQTQPTDSHLVWPLAPEFATYWREYLQHSANALPDFSLQLLRWQLVVLLQLEAGIDLSSAEAMLPADLPRPTHAADWLGLPLLLLRDDGLSQQWQWYFSEQASIHSDSEPETDSWPDRDWLLQQVAWHYQQQATINWHRLQQWFGAPAAGTAAQLPLYPYQRKNFWLDPLPATPVAANTVSTQLLSFGCPALMNEVQRLAGFPDLCWYRLLFDRQQQFLAQHLIFNTPISPAAAHVAMMLTALQQLGQPGWAIRQLELHQPLVLPAGSNQRAVQLTLKGELLNGAGSRAMAELRSAADAHSAATDWSLHARAEFSAVPDSLYRQQQRRLQQMFQAPPQDAGEIAAPWYQHLATLGYQLGDGYRRIKQIWRPAPYRAWCRVEQAEDQDLAGAVVAPGLVDSLLQSLISSVPDLIDQMQQGGWIYIPFSVGEIIPFAALDQPYYWCYSESKVQGPLLTGRVLVFGADGELKLLVDDFSVKQTDQRALLGRALAGPSAAEAANDPTAISWQKIWQAAPVVPPHVTSKEPAQFCLLTAPGATVPPQWQALIAQSQYPQAKRRLLLLSTQPVNRDLPEQFAEQAEWLRQQIPQWLMHDQQQLQLLLVDNQPDSPHSSALQAFQQVLRLEYPGQIADLLLLPTDAPASVLAEALQATPSALQGQIRRWQGQGPRQGKEHGQWPGQWQVPQLVAVPLPAPATSQPLDGTLLLTGGQSALAAVVLPQLLAQGAAAVVICSRRAEPADFAAWVSSLLPDATQAQRVHWSCTDVCDAAALALCLKQIEDTLPPLQGIWHCAGQLADVSLARMSAGQLSAVLAPKVRASLNLHQATLHLPLRQFVLFSSVAGVLGNFGQANYALGNGFMDGLAQLRQSQGLAGLSISWGPWQQGGMALQHAGKISAQGYQWLTPELLQPLWPALCAAGGHWLLAQADWPMLASRLQQPDLLNQLVSQSNISTQSSDPAIGLAPISSWQQLPRPDAQVAVEHWLSELVEEISGIAPDLTQSLMEQGIDSLGAVTIRSQLSQQLALSLPVSLLFNFPSVQALSGELCSRLFGAELVASSAEIPQDNQFNYLEDLSEAELNALILQEFSAV